MNRTLLLTFGAGAIAVAASIALANEATFSPGGEPVLVFPASTPTLEWTGEIGSFYAVRYSTDLENWEWDTIAQAGSSSATTTRDLSALPVSSEDRLFVCIIDDANSPDSDNDLLVDVLELAAGTDLNDGDTDDDKVSDKDEYGNPALNPLDGSSSDGDDLPDDWERFWFGNTSASNGGADDNDADGFTDEIEFQLGTDPTSSSATGKITYVYTPEGWLETATIQGNSNIHQYTHDDEGNILTAR